MIEQLHSSSAALKSALERHLDACSMVANSFESGNDVSAISQVVASELQSILSYEATIKHAKVKICRVRNSCRTIVPINNLPSEILTRIFQLVVHSQHYRYDEYKHSSVALPLTRPEVLSHVCYHWRQLANGFHGLWKHISLVPFHAHDGLIARGAVFAARTGSVPLEIHIIDGISKTRLKDPDTGLSSFCASVAPRISSLGFAAREGLTHAHLEVLKLCFANCVPGTLKSLSILTRLSPGCGSNYSFIEAESSNHPRGQALDIPNQHFEDILLHVKVLCLRGVYFHWNSRAYHGLTKLTLDPQHIYSTKPITESQLMGILAASPMLREFTFSLTMARILVRDTDSSPSIALNELEYLSLSYTNLTQRDALLRMISPGSNPLQMRMQSYGILPPLPDVEFDMFLARANVTELRIKFIHGSAGYFPNLPELLGVSPNLQNLVLYGCHLYRRPDVPETDGDEHLPAGLRLNSLNLFNCTVDLPHFRQVTKILPIHILRLSEDCRVLTQAVECQSTLSEIFPIVKLIVGKKFGDDWCLDG